MLPVVEKNEFRQFNLASLFIILTYEPFNISVVSFFLSVSVSISLQNTVYSVPESSRVI